MSTKTTHTGLVIGTTWSLSVGHPEALWEIVDVSKGWYEVRALLVAEGNTKKVRAKDFLLQHLWDDAGFWYAINEQEAETETETEEKTALREQTKALMGGYLNDEELEIVVDEEMRKRQEAEVETEVETKVEEEEEQEEETTYHHPMSRHFKRYVGGYQKAKNAKGTTTLTNGDAVALALLPLTPDQVEAVAVKLGIAVGGLYEHLNLGQKRMNYGNRIRHAIRKGESDLAGLNWAIAVLAKVA